MVMKEQLETEEVETITPTSNPVEVVEEKPEPASSEGVCEEERACENAPGD